MIPPDHLIISPREASDIRMRCIGYAMELISASIKDVPGVSLDDPKKGLELAKEIESWVMGGFAPVVRQPTPLGSIHEVSMIVRERVKELLENSADPDMQRKLNDALSVWERFEADITAALGDPAQP